MFSLRACTGYQSAFRGSLPLVRLTPTVLVPTWNCQQRFASSWHDETEVEDHRSTVYDPWFNDEPDYNVPNHTNQLIPNNHPPWPQDWYSHPEAFTNPFSRKEAEGADDNQAGEDDDEGDDEELEPEDEYLSRRSHHMPNFLAQGLSGKQEEHDDQSLWEGVNHTAGWSPDEIDYNDYSHVVDVKRHSNITGGGRVYSYSAIAVVGDGDGMSGWARARGNTAPLAIERARKQAEQKMVAIDRFRGGLAEDAYGICGKTKVRIRALQPDALISGHYLLRAIFSSFGLKAVEGKFFGPGNTRRRMVATYQALTGVLHPEMMARRTGQVWFDAKKIWRKGDRRWSYD